RGRFVDLCRMHRARPHPRVADDVFFRLGFACRTSWGERKPPRELRHSTKAAACEKAAHPAEGEAERDREARHVGGFPEWEPIAPEKEHGSSGRSEKPSVIGKPSGPELGPREAVGSFRMAHATRRIPDASVDWRDALGAIEGPVDQRGIGAEV